MRYRPSLRALLSTAVPCAFIAFYPSALLLRREAYWLAGIMTPVVGLLVFSVAMFIWRHGIRRYESAGS